MLNLEKLILERFGAYRERQTIKFGEGVNIIYAENTHGKTTILSALQYAFLGYVKSESYMKEIERDLVNYLAVEEGEKVAKIELYFTYNGKKYRVNRDIDITGKETVKNFFLKEDGNILSGEEAQRILGVIMPEDIAKFFLFDGEFLKDFERDLKNETLEGKKIKKGVEEILGLPHLVRAKEHVTEILETKKEELDRKRTKNKKFKKETQALQELKEEKSIKEKEIEEKIQENEKIQEKIEEMEDSVSKFDYFKKMIEDEKQFEQQLEAIDENIEALKEAIHANSKELWMCALKSKVNKEKQKMESEIEEMGEKEKANQKTLYKKEALLESLTKEICSSCGSGIDEEEKEKIKKEIEKLNEEKEIVDEELLAVTKERLKKLNKVTGTFGKEDNTIKEAEKTIAKKLISKMETKAKKNEIKKELANVKGFGEGKELKEWVEKLSVLKKNYKTNEDYIKSERSSISDLEKDINKARSKIKTEDEDVSEEERFVEIYTQAQKELEQSIHHYREKMKQKVQDTASKIFVKMTTQKDYKSLKINDNYGLSIVYEDGRPLALPSAGAAHIVLLSLIASLQKNSNVNGPLIMDSPLGRLDEGHVANVLKNLNEITHQSVLLVYKGELSGVNPIEALGDDLKKEYKVTMVSGKESYIEEGSVFSEY